jgi:hypothetical protein
MRKILLFGLLPVFMMITGDLNAQDYRTALGVRLSNTDAVINNSVSFKFFISNGIAADVLFTFSDPVALGVLLAKHKPTVLRGLTWFYGAGAYIGFSDPKPGGLMFALGLDYKLPSIPINLAFDWKPELNLSSPVHFEPAIIGGTVRFTF